MAGGTRDYDVAVLGAGLVGLALAASLARAGMRVAIVDRSSVDASTVSVASASATDEDWDARVYAVSPGSVAFLNWATALEVAGATLLFCSEFLKVSSA